MIGRFVFVFGSLVALPGVASECRAQDIPGIEICTAEKTMERRTSCLQSNVEFLQKTISRLTTEHQQKLDAAYRQIDGLKANLAALQKIVGDLQAAQQKTADDAKKTAAPAKDMSAKEARDGTGKDAPPKEGAKDGAKEGGK